MGVPGSCFHAECAVGFGMAAVNDEL